MRKQTQHNPPVKHPKRKVVYRRIGRLNRACRLLQKRLWRGQPAYSIRREICLYWDVMDSIYWRKVPGRDEGELR